MFRFASLTRRRRGRRLFEHLLSTTELAPLKDVAARRPADFRGPTPGPVVRRLSELLGDWEPDVDALDDWSAQVYREATHPDDRDFIRLHLAVWQRAPGFLEASGLVRDEPPESVHAMARGPLAAGGSFGAADMVMTALAGPDGAAHEPKRALDLGSSSGRVVRVLSAHLPGVEWEACDPNEAAIAWAHDHIPRVRFFVSPQEPPLPVPDGHYDLVFAVSVWSHFGAGAARRWLGEMHRVVAPGGLLVMTTQGFAAAATLAQTGEWQPVHLNEAIADLYARGYHFRDTFGEQGDHGVHHSEWGWAMTSPEWVLHEVTPGWSVRSFEPGAHEHTQDVWVLERRPDRRRRFQRRGRSARVPSALAP